MSACRHLSFVGTCHIFQHSLLCNVAGKHREREARWLLPETHTKRQATQHDCLPSLLGDGAGRTKTLFYRQDKPNEPTKKGTLSFVLFESPFTSVSTVSRGHPSLVSLAINSAVLTHRGGRGGRIQRIKPSQTTIKWSSVQDFFFYDVAKRCQGVSCLG